MKNLFYILVLLFFPVNIFSLHIKYDNYVITSESEYQIFLAKIARDPRYSSYIAIRDRIASSTTLLGPLISPNRGVFGAHYEQFNLDEDGYDLFKEHYATIINKDINSDNCELPLLISRDIYQKPGTDLCFIRFDDRAIHRKLQTCKPVTKIPILERASIDEIRDSKNSFYAFSNTLHGDNILTNGNKFTKMFFKYRNIVKCKPTLDDPSVRRTLKFDIDDAANLPMEFRTSHGDSVQPFFLMTPDNKLKVVGTHNPGGNYFLVENIAYPATATFIDKLIEKDVKVNDFVARGKLDPKDPNFAKLIKGIDSNSIRDIPVMLDNNLLNKVIIEAQISSSVESKIDSIDGVETPVPEPFSFLTMSMGVGRLIKKRCVNK